MSLIKNALLITCIYSGLIWAYCCFRVFTENFSFMDSFIYWSPISFLDLAMLTFIISGCSGFLFLIAKENEKL
jgi:hypothetical protein